MTHRVKRVFGAPLVFGALLVLVYVTAVFAGTPTPAGTVGQPPPATEIPAVPLTILGRVTNGTPGGPLPITKLLQFSFGEGIIALGLLTILAACIWQIGALRSRGPDMMGRRRALLQTIADLDEDYEAGKIDVHAYADRRVLLKAALVAALQEPALAMETASDRQT